jgi:hypothetical protein
VAELAGPGLVRRMNLDVDSGDDALLDDLHLCIRYDGQSEPAIDVAVSAFFGAGHGRALYQSLPIGTDSAEGFYCYWPIPFRSAVQVALRNTGTSNPVIVDSFTLEYEPTPVPADLCYLHAAAHIEQRTAGQVTHPMLQVVGRGHYVGNLLYVSQNSSELRMLEGDEVITVDGQHVLHGTGLEDAYNGGFYYNWVGIQQGEPEGPMPHSATRPLSGILYVDRNESIPLARADQYRWQIADRVPFQREIEVKIENQYAEAGATFTSVVFWYQLPPVPVDVDDDDDVDLRDFAAFQYCFEAVDAQCRAWFDANGDLVVDQADLPPVVALLTGPR